MAMASIEDLIKAAIASGQMTPGAADDPAAALRALQAGAVKARAPTLSPHDAMMHYQAMINQDPDYAQEKNPGARNPKYAGADRGPKSVRRERDTETERLQGRARDDKNRIKSLPYVSKQRSTKKEPVPRGTVGRKTEQELDIISKMMGRGPGKVFSTQ